MDRRRFVPSPEGLETRAVLSFFGTKPVRVNNPAQDVPVTFAQKELRIAHLPFYLNQMQPGRVLPQAVITQLQTDLTSIAGRLHKPNPATLEAFNTNLREVTPHSSLRPSDIKILDHSFRTVVKDTGATAQQVSSLSTDMLNLAKVDSQSRQPVFLGTNDYSLVLQTILGVGRPIQTPPAPQLALTDGIRVSTNIGKTANHQPRLVGVYGAGASVGVFAGNTSGGFNTNGVMMQIIDDHGTVFGQGPINAANGDYRVQVARPLADGVYRLHIRAVDAQGHTSDPSPVYLLKVVSTPGEAVATGLATPRGPLARSR